MNFLHKTGDTDYREVLIFWKPEHFHTVKTLIIFHWKKLFSKTSAVRLECCEARTKTNNKHTTPFSQITDIRSSTPAKNVYMLDFMKLTYNDINSFWRK